MLKSDVTMNGIYACKIYLLLTDSKNSAQSESVDYDFPSTVPVEGETLQIKVATREYFWRLLRLAGKVFTLLSKWVII